MTINKPKESVRFRKFILVGILNTLVDFGFMNLFTAAFNFSLVQAQAISFVLAVLTSYMLNRKWIYPDSTESSMVNQFGKFLLISLAGLAIRTILIPVCDRWFIQVIQASILKNGSVDPVVLSHNAALALVIPITMILNYLANRYWTFGDVGHSDKVFPG
ncbi:MAG: GtrA family protein [Anaerolineaceae bacterium]